MGEGDEGGGGGGGGGGVGGAGGGGGRVGLAMGRGVLVGGEEKKTPHLCNKISPKTPSP